MALRLKPRDIAPVNFRRVLPEWLGPGGECFIEVDARPGGLANPHFLAALESLTLKGRILDAKTKRIADDDEAFITARHGNVLDVVRARLAVLYDTCVIEWRSNIIDGDAPILCDRANFLALAEQKIPEIARAIADLEIEVLEAGKLTQAQDEDALKN